MRFTERCWLLLSILLVSVSSASAQPPDLIVHHGKIVTVDEKTRKTLALAELKLNRHAQRRLDCRKMPWI